MGLREDYAIFPFGRHINSLVGVNIPTSLGSIAVHRATVIPSATEYIYFKLLLESHQLGRTKCTKT